MKRFVFGSRFHYSRLTDYEKKIYRQLYDQWAAGESIVKVSFPGDDYILPTGTALHDLVQVILSENPHIFHLETSHLVYRRIGNEVTIEIQSVYTKEEYEQIYDKLVKRVAQIIEPAKKLSTDYEKFRYIHDYLVENVTYDKGAPDPRSQREVHTIVGSLLNSACVCDGFSRAFRLLCDQLKLSCIVAIGTAVGPDGEEPHAWNFVKLDGKVYHVDLAWESGYVKAGYPVKDFYFLRNDAVMSKDHTWDHGIYPPIHDDYPRRELMIHSKRELEQYVCRKMKEGQKELCFRLPASFPGDDALQLLMKKIVWRNLWQFARIGSYTAVYYDDIGYAVIKFYDRRG